jgi:hypothetical protein
MLAGKRGHPDGQKRGIIFNHPDQSLSAVNSEFDGKHMLMYQESMTDAGSRDKS